MRPKNRSSNRKVLTVPAQPSGRPPVTLGGRGAISGTSTWYGKREDPSADPSGLGSLLGMDTTPPDNMGPREKASLRGFGVRGKVKSA